MRTTSPQETRTLGRTLARPLHAGDVHRHVQAAHHHRGVAEGLGVTATVTSPSFTILNVYDDGRLPLYHFDWYRLESAEELYEMGMDEYLGGDGVAVVEWPSQCPEAIPETHLAVHLNPVGDNERDVTFTPMGDFRPIAVD